MSASSGVRRFHTIEALNAIMICIKTWHYFHYYSSLTHKITFSFNYNTTAGLREQAFNVTQSWPGILKSLLKFRFRDGLVWTVGLTVEIKLRFRDGLVWTVGLTVEIKFRFRDGLVWTVRLTVKIKLRFRDGLVWTVETVRKPNRRNKAPFS